MAEKKSVSRGTNNSGGGKKGFRPGPTQADRDRDRAITALPQNQRVRVLMPDLHTVLMSLPEYQAFSAARNG